MAPGDLVAIGVVGRPHGLKGHCHATALGETLGTLEPRQGLYLGRDRESAKPAVLAEIRGEHRGYVCRFEGGQAREAAEEIRGLWIYCEESDLPPLGDDEYYHFDLEGMTVFSNSTGSASGLSVVTV